MKRFLSVIHSEIDDFKNDGIIGYFFEDMEQYKAYKPFIKIIAVLGSFLILTSLICL